MVRATSIHMRAVMLAKRKFDKILPLLLFAPIPTLTPLPSSPLLSPPLSSRPPPTAFCHNNLLLERSIHEL